MGGLKPNVMMSEKRDEWMDGWVMKKNGGWKMGDGGGDGGMGVVRATEYTTTIRKMITFNRQ